MLSLITLVIYFTISIFIALYKYSEIYLYSEILNTIPVGDLEFHCPKKPKLLTSFTVLFTPSIVMIVCIIFIKRLFNSLEEILFSHE